MSAHTSKSGFVPQATDAKAEKAKPATELRAIDCNTPEDWARWARERREYDDPMGYSRGRY